MTQDEIIEMARQAGLAIGVALDGSKSVGKHEDKSFAVGRLPLEDFVDFAKLVAAKEREACEAVCNKLSANKPNEPTSFDFRYGAGCCAQAIRARGEA